MKKKWLFLALFFMAIVPKFAFAGNGDSESVSRDKVGYLGYGVERSSYVARVSSSGHIFSDFPKRNELGTPNVPWGNVRSSSITITDHVNASSGILNVHQYFSDIPATSVSTSSVLTYAASTTSVVGFSSVSVTADMTQPNYPRNVVFIATFTHGMATTTVTGSALVYGRDSLGLLKQETVSFSTTPGVGSTAFATISSITVRVSAISGASALDVTIAVGDGNKIGLANKLYHSSDIYKVLESGADVATSNVTIDTTNSTITFSTLPNGSRDYNVWMNAKLSPPLYTR